MISMKKISLLLFSAAAIITIASPSCAPSPVVEREVDGYSLRRHISDEDMDHHISKRRIIQLVKTSKGLKIDPRFNYSTIPSNKSYSHIVTQKKYGKEVTKTGKISRTLKRILHEEWPSVQASRTLPANEEETLVLSIRIDSVNPISYSKNSPTLFPDEKLMLFSYTLGDANSGDILARAKYLGKEPNNYKGELPGIREFIRFTTEKDPLANSKFRNYELFSETWKWKTGLDDYYILYKKETDQLQQQKGYVPPR